MNAQKITLDLPFLNKLFPFFLLIDRDLKIAFCGSSLNKICSIELGTNFHSLFKIIRPRLDGRLFRDLASLNGQLVFLEFSGPDNTIFNLRGQLDFLDQEEHCLFTGSPWFQSIDELTSMNLTLHDFALHDPMIDLLHVLKSQEITMKDAKILLEKVHKQKDELIESEIKYRNIVENATDIIYKINSDGIFTFANEVAVRITEFSQEELLSMHYLDLIRNDYHTEAILTYTKQIKENIPTTYFEFPMISKSGKQIWIGQNVQYPLIKNENIELTAIAMDISIRKHAELSLKFQEEKYRNIIANMNLGLLEVDLDDKIQSANHMFTIISGYNYDELIGKKAMELLIDAGQQDFLFNKLDERKEGKSDMYSIPIVNKNGEKRWWLISGAPRYNDDGEIVGTVGIHLDVTEQKKIEQQLVEAKIKAEESSKAKEFFLATMSHEIRTPLNAIVGLSDLMQMDKKAITETNLKILNFSSKNLHALISGILDITKIDAGKIELVKHKFNLMNLIEGVWLSFKPACDDKNINFSLEFGDLLPPMIIGDELRLSQILNNLIGNAIKFTTQGFVKLMVKSEAITDEKVRILFTVADSGIGIRKKNLKFIFQAFEQADRNIVRQFGGTGLGLSITQKLIQLHGSDITATSTWHKGSVFKFNIDYQIASEKNKTNASKQISTSIQDESLAGKKILLVEDNKVNQLIAVSYLTHWELNTDIVNNGKEALEMLEKKEYDLILLDIFMPVMDGFETTKKIRQNHRWKHIPIIALTASAEVTILKKMHILGANLCLTKPLDSLELFQAMNNLIKSKKKNKAILNTSKKSAPTPQPTTIIRLNKIEEASLGSSQFILDMITLLLTEIPQIINTAEIQLQEKKLLLFSSSIHKLKNNLLMLSMEQLREDLNFLEEHAKKTSSIRKLKTVFNRVTSCWQIAALELKAIKSKKEQ